MTDHRALPRYRQQPITHDPLETMLAQREAQHEAAITTINAGTHLTPDPADLRGIPCIAHGVGGTSPGTSPHTEASTGRMDNHRLRRTLAA